MNKGMSNIIPIISILVIAIAVVAAAAYLGNGSFAPLGEAALRKSINPPRPPITELTCNTGEACRWYQVDCASFGQTATGARCHSAIDASGANTGYCCKNPTCIAGYVCNSTNKCYQNTNCTQSSCEICQYGCLAGTCNLPPGCDPNSVYTLQSSSPIVVTMYEREYVLTLNNVAAIPSNATYYTCTFDINGEIIQLQPNQTTILADGTKIKVIQCMQSQTGEPDAGQLCFAGAPPSCTAGYMCSGTNKCYLNTNCSFTSCTNCSYGCTSGACNPSTLPATPTGLHVVSVTDCAHPNVAIAWTASTGAISYNVYGSTSISPTVWTLRATINATSYTDAVPANPMVTYYHQVSAVNAGGESANTNQVSSNTCGDGVCGCSNGALEINTTCIDC
jgi:hypothetical protein